jgi:hypothetical protein
MCKVPAALQLDRAAVARLLQAAMQQQQGFFECLMELPAMQQLSADVVQQLLHALLESRSAHPNRFAA